MHRTSIRDSVRHLFARQRKSRGDRLGPASSGWTHILRINADEIEPGAVMIATRKSEDELWTEIAVGSADVEQIVQRLLDEGEKAKRALRNAAPGSTFRP